MSQADRRRLDEYFDPKIPLRDHFNQLTDVRQFPDYRSAGLNEAIMGFVAKFLVEYLQIVETEVSVIQETVRKKVKTLEGKEISRVCNAAFEGKVEGTSDAFGVQCLADIQGTAGLFKEIAFGGKFEIETHGEFIGADLGSGTGILGAAIAIAGIRAGARKTMISMVEGQKNAVDNSRRVVSQIDGVHFDLLQADLRDQRIYRLMYAPPLRVGYWVSETFGHTTPKLVSISEREIVWGSGAEVSMFISGALDPYADVLHNLMQHTPSFYQRVRQGKAALFPDPINGKFLPDNSNSKITLNTEAERGPILLREVRNEFERFEDFNVSNTRWG